MRKFIECMFLFLCTFFYQSCTDEDIVAKVDNGKVISVKLSLNFSEMDMVSPNSRSAGDGIDAIKNVCVLFYQNENLLKDNDGNPIYIYSGDISTYETKTEESTQKVSFTKKITPGSYRIYAIANMGDLTKNNKSDIETTDGLKKISLTWNNSSAVSNNQMFGFFNYQSADNIIGKGESNLSRINPTDYDAPLLQLSEGQTAIAARLYRAVSKVTVAFNAASLQKNTFITIKTVTLKNIPSSCALWEENKPNGKGLVKSEEEMLHPERLVVSNKGQGASVFPSDAHSSTGESLFMFENRQGIDSRNRYEGHKDKLIDRMPNGAYLEIKGYYNDETPLTGSHGEITYRCMLGEDIGNSFNNYNVTRNRHYKVTLIFNGSAKDNLSWRIEYDEDTEINIPSEVHISYRHESKLEIPFSVTKSQDVASVTARIKDNPWYDLISGGEALNVRRENKEPKFGFLCWGDETVSNNKNWSSNKTELKPLFLSGDGHYTLNVQTEALGFKTSTPTDYGDTFSGYNNFSNERTATVEVTVNYENGERMTKEVKIVQEPRIVNPIAVYRDWNEDNAFHIRLLNAVGAEIQSYGPWRAEIKSGADWILLSKDGSSYNNGIITSGESGGTISFYYKPNGKLSRKDATPRCGVISVWFSNENVEHQIYVRQGYAPMAIGSKESLWTSYNYMGTDNNNNRGKDLFADSPLEEGAWLKRGRKEGILAKRDNTTEFGQRPDNLMITTWGSRLWGQINASFTTDISVTNYRLPDQADLQNIMSCKPYSGFGVAYDGHATETVAFDEDSQYDNSRMGRRGIVICDDEGRNIFFPIGKAGYGRRHREYCDGGLHYANERYRYGYETTKGKYRPTLIELYKALGAFYWTSGGNNENGNQITFNYSLANIESQARSYIATDACYVRLISNK